VQGQANDERGAVAAHFEARFCTFGRDGSCHGWLGGGVHFRFLTEIGTRGVAWRAAVSRPCGCTGAAISRQRNARPPDSMLILPYRPSQTHTLLRAGTMCPLCGSSWKKRLSYRTTQSSLTVRSLSSRKIRSSSSARGARPTFLALNGTVRRVNRCELPCGWLPTLIEAWLKQNWFARLAQP